MKKISLLTMLFLFIAGSLFADDKQKIYLPWENGKLQVSDNGRYLQHENGTPFFWMGETGWLLPEKLNRDEASYYLSHCREAGFNVVQVQTVNGVPAINDYGQFSFPDGFNFKNINKKGVYGYWDHMDYIIKTAEKNGIYIGMVCIWGNLVKAGLMNEEEAKAYGTFLAERYKDSPNIIWFIGGDVRGDIKPEVWNTLARTIKSIDKNHLMTFHPFGRTSSIYWFHDAEWLDFNMFQSGHRRYDQTRGDGDNTAEAVGEEITLSNNNTYEIVGMEYIVLLSGQYDGYVLSFEGDIPTFPLSMTKEASSAAAKTVRMEYLQASAGVQSPLKIAAGTTSLVKMAE